MESRKSSAKTARRHQVRYEKPRLKRFGDVAELTLNTTSGNGTDNNQAAAKKTQ